MKVWIVGQVKNTATLAWEFQGVFDSEELAVAACVENLFFVMPAILNQQLPVEMVPAPVGSYYPRLQDKPRADAAAVA